MWPVDITFPTDINLRMSQDLRSQIQIKRKGAPINDYWSSFRIKQPPPPSAWPFSWSWINAGYKFRGKKSFGMVQPSSQAWKAAYPLGWGVGEYSFGWLMDVLFLDERRVTPVPTVLNMPSSHIAAQTSFLSVVLNMTKEGENTSPWQQVI